MRRLSHAQYYQDRSSEYELCKDFPADEILIEGLHTMQSHFRANHVAIDIPVVRVMNAAHFIASYMFNTECSGDQLEYDVYYRLLLDLDSEERTKKLFRIVESSYNEIIQSNVQKELETEEEMCLAAVMCVRISKEKKVNRDKDQLLYYYE